MFQHMLVPTETPVVTVTREDLPVLAPRVNPSSVPDDPDRAAAAKAGRQEAAAKARAAKAAKQAEAPEAEDLSGPVPGTNGAAGDQAEDQAEEDLGLDDPSMGPGDAKEQGLVLMRELYAAGKVEGVKKLQKAWGIAKFYDIPVERGHEFYRQAMKLAVDAGLRK